MGKRFPLAVTLIGLSVVVVSIFTGHHLPLYDGLAAPDEAYRYVVGGHTSKPTVARTTYTVSSTMRGDDFISAQSQESGPQVSFLAYANTYKLTGGVTSITVQAVPKAPGTSRPANGKIAGNIYTFTATSDTGKVAFVRISSSRQYIDLRLPQGYSPGATITYQQAASAWKDLPTTQVGNDIYEAPLVGFGDYALIVKKAKPVPPVKTIVPIVCFAAVFILVIVLIRQHTAAEDEDGTHGPKHRSA